MYFHNALVISLGVTFPVPKTFSIESVHPLKQIAYPPKGFFATILFPPKKSIKSIRLRLKLYLNLPLPRGKK